MCHLEFDQRLVNANATECSPDDLDLVVAAFPRDVENLSSEDAVAAFDARSLFRTASWNANIDGFAATGAWVNQTQCLGYVSRRCWAANRCWCRLAANRRWSWFAADGCWSRLAAWLAAIFFAKQTGICRRGSEKYCSRTQCDCEFASEHG